MSIKLKLIILVAVLIAAMTSTGIFSIYTFNETNKQTMEIQEDAKLLQVVKHVQYRLAGISNDERAFLINGDPQFPEGMAEKKADIGVHLQEALELVASAEETEHIKEIQSYIEDYWAVSEQTVNLYQTDQNEALALHFEEERTIRKEQLDPSINEIIEAIEAEMAVDNQRLADQQERNTIILVLLVLLTLLFGSMFAWFIITSIMKPLRLFDRQLQEISQGGGDLTQKIALKTNDEFSKLAHSFNQFTASLRDMIERISDSAQFLASSSAQVTASADQSVQAVEHVTSSIQQIAGGAESSSFKIKENAVILDQIESGVTGISIRSEELKSLSLRTLKAAEEGGLAVQDNVRQMQFIFDSVAESHDVIRSLSDRSNEIGSILTIISGIADQTNLLALNASIEAARAGEHGKGFAVVAEEVRKLAEQSLQSSKQIGGLIDRVQKDSEQSVRIMGTVSENASVGLRTSADTSEKFRDIMDRTNEMVPRIERITAALRQINERVATFKRTADVIAETAEESARNTEGVSAAIEEQLASMEEISAAVKSIAQTADDLQSMVHQFKI
ncbi:methyl-accepting chemotaxis protein [Domibacillus tundrae]|uniref:methyl-accepting chemotaxis protein n=1 Tax=Domibacillus tundrae TaxID=1587527 RepID=UPI000697ED80|nr:methyl-accepting chemotaxis protein [Domibacillus tundrae]